MRTAMGILSLLAAILFTLLFTPSPFAQVENSNSCYVCHIQLGGRMRISAQGWEQSVHKEAGITCERCHGGNPSLFSEESMGKKYGFKGKPERAEIPPLCGGCHSRIAMMKQYNIRTDQYAEYKTSQHGILLSRGDRKVATCVDCHGTHKIVRVRDPNSPVFHTNVPGTCNKCHGDSTLMEKYSIASNQYDLYRKGTHGKILFGEMKGKNPMLAPNCATCHGIHGAQPPGIDEVVNVCGHCHQDVYKSFKAGPHGEAVKEAGEPQCVDCHGNHMNRNYGLTMFEGEGHGRCGFCHEKGTREYEKGQAIKDILSDIHNRMEKLKQRVEQEKQSGMDVTKLTDALSKIRTHYVEMIPKTHGVDPELLSPYAREVEDQMHIARKELNKIRNLKKRRMRHAGVGITLLLILAGLFVVKLKSVRGKK